MSSTPSTAGLIRASILPALLVFALPLFALWFSDRALDQWDAEVLTSVERSIAQDKDLEASQRSELLAFYRAVPASVACMSSGEELAEYRQNLGEGCSDFRQFGWARAVANASILVGLLSALVAALCALGAFLSRPIQYGSFVVGWNVLRITSALQTVAQGGLAVWLSFWITALWFERYFPKLIIAAAIIALGAVFMVLVAIFKRPPEGFAVEAELLEESQAPEFWAHVRALCARVQTAPPDHILVGIDDNFFVTESKVLVGERELEGRTLFASLSLLGQLERSEADAVLAHEMAHLLGGDTGHSKKLAPGMMRFGQYMEALQTGMLTLPIYFFMRAYRVIFELALSRSSREAEFAADALAAKTTSPGDIARSLVKVGAYSSFRQRVEADLFDRQERQSELGISQRVAVGFTGYAQSDKLHADLESTITPHPFDSHPPLAARLANVGESFEPALLPRVLLEPRTSSWLSAIPVADEIESRMWKAYEDRFARAHEFSLALRYEPANEEEKQLVEKHFPPLTFAGKDAGYEVQLDYAGVNVSDWEAPVAFSFVGSVSTEERLFKKYLDLLVLDGPTSKSKRSVCTSKLAEAEAFLEAFGRYYGRHQYMEKYREELAAKNAAA